MEEPAQTLRDLIERAKVKHGTQSLRALARISRERGGSLSHTTLSVMGNGEYSPSRPNRDTLQEIADLAGVSYGTAHEAAGLGKPRRRFADQIPDRFDELTSEHRDVVLTVARALLNAQVGNSPATGAPATNETNFDHDRVTTKEASDLAWADDEGIFGPDGGSRSEQEM